MKELTKAEERLLLAIMSLRENAYGVAIRKKIKKKTGKILPYGTLYFILEQLTKKGFVKRYTGESRKERGEWNRIYYILTSKGHNALKESYEMHQKIWEEYADMSPEKEFAR